MEKKLIIKNIDIKDYKEIDDELIQIMASDETVDRDKDVIKADGWSTDNWLKTGALLYGHDSSKLPVGSAAKAEITNDGRLLLYSKLAKKGTSEWHDTIRSLIDQKILKGVSVGFIGEEYDKNDHGGLTFTKQELLEISLTPIPANANARLLVKDYSEEIKDKLFKKQFEEEEESALPQEEIKVVEPELQEEEVAGYTEKEEKFLKLVKNIIGEK